jgi:thiol-disulfide isomerase/thioredoxin
MLSKRANLLLLLLYALVFLGVYSNRGRPLNNVLSVALFTLLVGVLPLFCAYCMQRYYKATEVKSLNILLVSSIVVLIVTLCCGAIFNIMDRFFITCLLYFLCGWYFIKRERNAVHWQAVMHILYIPYVLMIMPIAFFLSDFPAIYFLAFASIAAMVLVWLVGKFRNKWLEGVGALVCILLLSYTVYPNYIASLNSKISNKSDSRISLPLVSERGDTLSVAQMKPKVIVMDFWFSQCGACFRSFPKYAALKEHFKDQDVLFSVVNVPLTADSGNIAFDAVRKYGFTSFVSPGYIAANSWHIDGYPTTVIYDAKRNLRFQGQLELNRTVRNNAYNIIQQLIAE